MSFYSISLIIVVILIISFLIFMITTTDNNNKLDEFKRKADIIDIDLTKVKVKPTNTLIMKANKDSTTITVLYDYKGKEFKHEEIVDRSEKFVRETLYIRRETTLFVNPNDPTDVYLDLMFLFIPINKY